MRPRASRPLITLVAAMQTICLVGVALALAGCGGSDNDLNQTTTTNYVVENYSIGGTVSGLTVSNVVLANGTATVSIPANTTANVTAWNFPATFAPGTSYSVTVQTQPSGEQCEVTSGASGADTGDVGNVTVVCGYGQWTWKGGLNTVNASGVYGTQGTASATNAPGGRNGTSSWTDASGNFWLFGGVGYDSTGGSGYLNDLWQRNPSTGLWTWVSGGNSDDANGVYGTQGTGAAGNVPGARQAASSWTDSAGNLWLFGGVGYSSGGAVGSLNDLWQYNPSIGLWTWFGGGTGVKASGVYGTQGTASAGNVPGARQAATSWVDTSGNLWLFGGVGYDSTGALGSLNDLWQYTPSTGLWTWVSGGNGVDASGVYGTQGTAATTNAPGARYSASSWSVSGNLWLFGGYGYDSIGTVGKLNDLWQFSTSSGQWTWINGQDGANPSAIYGTLGNSTADNLPGARQAATSWTDSSGYLWLFGGVGFDSTGAVGNLNDLWRYIPSVGQWTWVSGANVENATGFYGTQGNAGAGNVPGGRSSMSSWIDSAGNMWLFGGYGYDSTGNLGYLNDLWQYDPST
jgi:N-acetylneuraminic acid mutarotase